MAADLVGGTEYIFGNQLILSVVIRQSGQTVDPTEVTLIMEEPDGTETTEVYNGGAGNVQKTATGNYNLPFTITQVGTHEYRWKTTGPIGAVESWFTVPPSRVANP